MLQSLDFLIGTTLALLSIAHFIHTVKVSSFGHFDPDKGHLLYFLRVVVASFGFVLAWWFFTVGIRALVGTW